MKDHGPIDITTLALEQPRTETVLFDPQVDITEEQWGAIIEEFQEEKKAYLAALKNQRGTDIRNLALFASAVVLLSPQRIPLLKLEEIPPESIRTNFNVIRQISSPVLFGFTYRLAAAKIAFQKSSEELGIQLNWPAIKNALDSFRQRDDWKSFLWLAKYPIIIDPNKASELNLDEEARQQNIQLIKSEKNQASPESLVELASSFKILFPQDTSILDTEFDYLTWQKLKSHLAAILKWPSSLCSYLPLLAILAAQKVEITDRGIELVFDRSEPFKEQIPPMPVTRRF